MSDKVVKGRPHYAGLLGLLALATQPDAPSGWVVWDGRDYVWMEED